MALTKEKQKSALKTYNERGAKASVEPSPEATKVVVDFLKAKFKRTVKVFGQTWTLADS